MDSLEKPSIDEAMLHFGVKGMKWGTTRERTPSQQIQKINKKISKTDSTAYLNGTSLIGYQSAKMHRKALRKNPDFKVKKLSKAEQDAWAAKAARKSNRASARNGAVAVGVILAGTYGLTRLGRPSPNATKGAMIAGAMLAGQIGFSSVQEIRSVKLAQKVDKLKEQRDKLGYRPDRDWKH
jgi:hypothetical protein